MTGYKRLAARRAAALLGSTAATLVHSPSAMAQSSLLEVNSGPTVRWDIAINDHGAGPTGELYLTAEEACRVSIEQTRDNRFAGEELPVYSSAGPVESGTNWNTKGYYARKCNNSSYQDYALAVCLPDYGIVPVAGGLDVRCVREDEPAECDPCKPGDTPLAQPPLPRIGGISSGKGSSPMSIASGGSVSIDSGALKLGEEDYASADGLLRVARLYNSAPVQKPLKAGDETQLAYTALPGFGEAWSGLIPGRLVAFGRYISTDFVHLGPSGTMTRFRTSNAYQWNYRTADVSRTRLELVQPSNISPPDFARSSREPGAPEAEIRLSLANGDYVLFRRAGRFDHQVGTRTLVPVEQGFASGYRLFFAYGADDLHPETIRDSFGRELRLTWTDIAGTGAFAQDGPRGKAISAIALPDATRLEYQYGLAAVYDGAGWQNRLEQVRRLSAVGEVLWGRSYRYDDAADPLALTGIDDAAGNRLSTTTYNTAGRVTSTERAGGVDRWTLRYFEDRDNPDHDVRRITNPSGREETYTFARTGEYAQGPGRAPRKLLEVRGRPAGEPGSVGFVPADSRSFHYRDEWGTPSLLQGAIDPNGNSSEAELDAANMRPAASTNAAGETTRISWTPGLDLPAHLIHPSGLHSFFEYSPEGRLLSTTQAAQSSDGMPFGPARTTRYSWSPEGRLLSINGPRDPAAYGGQDDLTSFTYDAVGNRLTMTNALAHVTRYGAYDANGNPGEMVDANGVRTLFSYDALGRLASSTVKHPADAALDAVTTYEHDSEGRLLALTRPDTARLLFDYDLAGRLTAMRSEDGERIDYTYDAASNVMAETVRRADGSQARGLTRAFDALSRLVSETLGPGRTTTWAYDRNGNPTRVTSPRGFATTNAFDALDRVVATVAPASGRVRTTYDTQSEVKSFSDAGGVTTRFSFNVHGDLLKEISPDRGTTTYRYDDAGDLLSVTDGRGAAVRYQHDILGRVTRKTPDDPAQSVFYGWDEPDTEATNRIGRLTRIRDASGTMTFNYDHRGNLIIQRQNGADGAEPLFLRYAYDLADRIVRMTYPSGRQVAYRRDAKGRVQSVLTRASTADSWTTLASNMRYEPFGPLAAASLGNGLRVANDWGNDGRLAVRRLFRASDNVNLSRLAYDFDADDNIVRIRDLLDPARSQVYAYDEAGRITRLDTGLGAVRRVDYRYDANGNRLAQESRALPGDAAPLATDSYSYNAGTNRLSEIVGPAGARTLTYDGRGNTAGELRPDGVAVTTSYDGFGRLTGYQRSDTSLQFTYNGRDDRVAMTRDTVRSVFVYDPSGRVIGEYGPAGAADPKAEFIWTLPEVSAAGTFGGDDGLGGYQPLAVAAIGAQSGVTELAWTHGNHLGVPLVHTDAQGNSLTAELEYLVPGFPGQSRVLSDLYHNRHRDFDPTTGRYIQADPIGLAGGSNLYLYAGGNPVGAIDPLGLSAVGVVGRILAADIVTPDPFDVAPLPKLAGYALALAGAACVDYVLNNSEADAEAKAPGQPGPEDGYKAPKGGPRTVKGPKGKRGWIDADGNVWVPTGPAGYPDAHGGAHWDVQGKRGGYRNVYPGGRTR